MDQIKIGKFISECRKEKNLTQNELAEKLGITDRAVSKWERGICLPDAGLMIALCKLLGITVNELLTGEKIDMKNNEEKMDENLVKLAKKNEESNRMLLKAEMMLVFLVVVMLCGVEIICNRFIESNFLRTLITIGGFVIALIVAFFGIHIETKAGYYECKHCRYKYVPKIKSVLFAMHIGTTRYMKCPECGKKSWQKKVLK